MYHLSYGLLPLVKPIRCWKVQLLLPLSSLDSPEKYVRSDFKINGSAIDKNRNHLQSIDSNIDSNRRTEKDMLVSGKFDAKPCGKKPQERNTGINKPGSSIIIESTNPINPSKLFATHQSDSRSADPKAEDMSSVDIEKIGKFAHHQGVSSIKGSPGNLLPLNKHSGGNSFKRKYFDENPDYKAHCKAVQLISNGNSSSDKITTCRLFLMKSIILMMLCL